MGATTVLMTAEQLLDRASDGRSELVRGVFVELPPRGALQAFLLSRLVSWLAPFLEERRIGVIGISLGVILERHPDTVRAPDLSLSIDRPLLVSAFHQVP